MKTEVIIITISIIVVILGMYLCYRKARNDRFSPNKKVLFITMVMTVIELIVFCMIGLVLLLLVNYKIDEWYLVFLIIIPYVFNLFFTLLGYKKIGKFNEWFEYTFL